MLDECINRWLKKRGLGREVLPPSRESFSQGIRQFTDAEKRQLRELLKACSIGGRKREQKLIIFSIVEGLLYGAAFIAGYGFPV